MGSPKGEKHYYQTVVQEYYSRSSSGRFFTTCVAFHAVLTASFRKCRFIKRSCEKPDSSSNAVENS